ncbi:myb-like protein X [Phalaenopsis equestris]|uniref:myb-like protein X n=1 Tax=Phalaenopsis equestris TaxID=78828 RepID=UPI0009E30C43|nr:myb-like protein X [Phalaenopsis equestris]XP_020579803.1 myb-like protein X [Phalaenopsis equestris]
MSRCFPFPPPGYEKKPEAENLDLLTKEKRKEKKHKKEKKDKEKREHKEKKEKDRSKDKRKEKKDRKEKHKDRKKDKDVEKGKSSEDKRAEDGNEGTHNRESLQKEEVKDSKLAEELDRRTRFNGADNQMVAVTSSIPKRIEPMGVIRPSLEKDIRVAEKKVFPVPTGSSQRNDGSSLSIENSTISPHRRIGNISTATSTDQGRTKSHERFTVGFNADQIRNHGISRSMEGISMLPHRKAEYSTSGMEKEKFSEKFFAPISVAPPIDNKGKLGAKVVASHSASIKGKNDLLGHPVESLSSSIRSKTESNSVIQSRVDGLGSVPAVDKERAKGSGIFPHPLSSEQRRNTTIFPPVQRDKNQRFDKDKEHTATKKNKPKDADKHSKEEAEKITEKVAVIENNKIRNIGKKDQIEALNNKLSAPHKDNTADSRDVDETSNKRKNVKINGFMLENDARPNKMPRMMASSPSQPLAGLPLKPDRILLDYKDKVLNGSAKPQLLPDGNGDVSLKPPHPDSKYLEQIYTVPKMELLPENGDMEWLFSCGDSSQQKPKRSSLPPVSDESISPRVWSKALWIESADVLALPYVVPF